MRLAAFLAIALLASPAQAWDAAGHLLIAGMAYDRLTPGARARVDDLIRKHPDYATVFLRNATGDDATIARTTFMRASIWPDLIRGDRRFYDDADGNAEPTPKLPGFPDMKRHNGWHIYSRPFSQDGTKLPHVPKPNALTELPRLIEALNGSKKKDDPVYDLPWFVHIASDIHNPVHCATRFSQSQPDGDNVGTRVFVAARGGTLHAVWDSALDRTDAQQIAAEFAADLSATPDLNPKHWVEESFDLAVTQAYTFGPAIGTREQPIQLPAGYIENAQKVSREQAAIAATRIAAILNERLTTEPQR